MKQIAFLLLILCFASCKKEVVVTPAPVQPYGDNLYEYRLDSLSNTDTAIVMRNSTPLQTAANFSIVLNKGDTISFYFSGKNRAFSSVDVDKKRGFNFAIWKNDNNLPDVHYFYSQNTKTLDYVYYFWLPNANNYSSVTYYTYRHVLKGQYIIP